MNRQELERQVRAGRRIETPAHILIPVVDQAEQVEIALVRRLRLIANDLGAFLKNLLAQPVEQRGLQRSEEFPVGFIHGSAERIGNALRLTPERHPNGPTAIRMCATATPNGTPQGDAEQAMDARVSS